MLLAISLLLCSTASAAQGGGGESTKKGSTKKKAVTKKKSSGTSSAKTTPPTTPPAPPARPTTPTRASLSNSPGPSTTEEWRLASVAAQTATREIGKYRYMAREKSDGKLHNPFEKRPQLFGTITLSDVGVTLSSDQPDGLSETQSFRFYEWGATTIWRSNYTGYLNANQQFFHVSWKPYANYPDGNGLNFDTPQERDRFFADLARTFQEWKTKYAAFQFAAGKLTINWTCSNGQGAAPCADSTPSSEKPVWQTPTYRVTVESLERNANNYIATLVFENLTDETIDIGWQEKNNLLPTAVGPYLIDERGEKYFALGTDSGNIIVDGMTWIWVSHTGILPKTKLTSRFMFSGNGDGKIFNLEAQGIEDLAKRPITIKGLTVTSDSR